MTAPVLPLYRCPPLSGEDPCAAIPRQPGRPFVVAQLGQSIDGRIATPTGASRYINRQAALTHLHRLRAHVDAVIVGIGTVLADDPALTVRHVDGDNPARVVIDARGRLDAKAKVLADDGVRRIVVRGEGAPDCRDAETIRLPAPDGRIAPSDIVAALAERGLSRLLVEGGATMVSAFVAAGMVDRLHVLVGPMILGSGRIGLDLPPIAGLDEALTPTTRVYPLMDGDVLFDCDLTSCRSEAEPAAAEGSHG